MDVSIQETIETVGFVLCCVRYWYNNLSSGLKVGGMGSLLLVTKAMDNCRSILARLSDQWFRDLRVGTLDSQLLIVWGTVY